MVEFEIYYRPYQNILSWVLNYVSKIPLKNLETCFPKKAHSELVQKKYKQTPDS